MKLGHNVVRNRPFWSEFLMFDYIIDIMYNTANNAVNYIQIHIFIVKK